MINFCREKLGFLWDDKEMPMHKKQDEYIKMHKRIDDCLDLFSIAARIPRNRFHFRSFFKGKE